MCAMRRQSRERAFAELEALHSAILGYRAVRSATGARASAGRREISNLTNVRHPPRNRTELAVRDAAVSSGRFPSRRGATPASGPTSSRRRASGASAEDPPSHEPRAAQQAAISGAEGGRGEPTSCAGSCRRSPVATATSPARADAWSRQPRQWRVWRGSVAFSRRQA